MLICNTAKPFKLFNSYQQLTKGMILGLGFYALSLCGAQAHSTAPYQTDNAIQSGSIINGVIVNNQTATEILTPPIGIDTLDIDALPSSFIEQCSADFQRAYSDFIQAPVPLYPEQRESRTIRDFIQNASENETLNCELGALNFAAQASRQKLQLAKPLLQVSALSNIERLQLQRYISKVQLDLFNVYFRQGLLTEGAEALVYGKEANLLWSEWASVPVDLSSNETQVAKTILTQTMTQAIGDLVQYLQTHQRLLAQQPAKRAIIIDQALIYVIQLNEQYAESKTQILEYSASKDWVINFMGNNGQPYTTEPVSHAATDTVIESMLHETQSNQTQMLTQFVKLATMRYENFDKEQMLESAKAFIIQDVDDKLLSQLLVAMDYAQLGDKASSKRWLDKIANNTALRQHLCDPNIEDEHFVSNSALFATTEGRWFRRQLMATCW